MNPMRLGGNNKRTDESWIAPTFSGLAALPCACVMSRWYPTSGPTAPERPKKGKKEKKNNFRIRGMCSNRHEQGDWTSAIPLSYVEFTDKHIDGLEASGGRERETDRSVWCCC